MTISVETMVPTATFRWLQRGADRVLQQRFLSGGPRAEWVDVPTFCDYRAEYAGPVAINATGAGE